MKAADVMIEIVSRAWCNNGPAVVISEQIVVEQRRQDARLSRHDQ